MDNLTASLNDAITVNINKALLRQVAEKPTAPLLNLEDITVDIIKDYLLSKHSSTWSIFSIGHEDTLEKAAEWFKRELDLLYTFTYRPEEYAALLDGTTRPR